MRVLQIDTPAVGKSTTLEAQLTGAHEGDPVEFFEEGTPIGTANVNAAGLAQLSWTPATAGNRKISATYAPTDFSNPAGPATANANVAQSTVGSTTNLGPVTGAQEGRVTTLTATVAPGDKGGAVEFFAGNVRLGENTVEANGRATFTWAPAAAGTVTIKAKYKGVTGVDGSETSANVNVAHPDRGGGA